MHHPPAPHAARPLHSSLARLSLLAVALGGCSGETVAPDVGPLRASLRVSAAIATSTATGIEVSAGYLRGSQRIELALTGVAVGAGTQQERLALDLRPCLADPLRTPATPGACALDLQFRLLRGTTLLDVQSVQVPARPGESVTAPPVTLHEVRTVRVTAPGATTSADGALVVRVEAADTLRLSAAPVDASGAVLAGRPVQWASATPTVARVDATSGLVTGVAPGTATIQATTAGGQAAGTVAVTVVPASVRTLAAAASRLVLEAGESRPAAVTARDASGGVLAGRAIAYASRDTAIASVAADGTVLGRRVGSTTLTATSAQGPNGTTVRLDLPVDVVAPAVAALAASPVTVGVGASATLAVTARDARGSVLTGRTLAFRSSDATIATVSPAGVVQGVRAGTTSVIVSSGEGPNGTTVQTTVPVTVTARSFSLTVQRSGTGSGTVSVSPQASSYPEGTVVTLTATPDAGSLFAGWSGGGCGTGPTCAVTMTQNLLVVASFAPQPPQQWSAGWSLTFQGVATTSVDGAEHDCAHTITVRPSSTVRVTYARNASGGRSAQVQLHVFEHLVGCEGAEADSEYSVTLDGAVAADGSFRVESPAPTGFSQRFVVTGAPDASGRLSGTIRYGWEGSESFHGEDAVYAVTYSGSGQTSFTAAAGTALRATLRATLRR